MTFIPEMRPLVSCAITLNISSINTYSGYKGDIVLKFTSADPFTVTKIENFCNESNTEIVIKYNHNMGSTDMFCIFEDTEVYSLK